MAGHGIFPSDLYGRVASRGGQMIVVFWFGIVAAIALCVTYSEGDK